MKTTEHRVDIDVLKGFAIVAVILFHMYILKSGYLGVDLFFVISGYLLIPKLCNQFCEKKLEFKYFPFEKKRIMRLWPLIVIAGIISLAIGFIGMLPDDYENLTENIIASNFFSTNILSSITIKDYWSVRASYQPLMHLWYVGILIEYYLFLPIILYGVRSCSVRLGWNIKKSIVNTLLFLSAVSIILYLLPTESSSTKFYLLPYRFFELTVGGLFLIRENVLTQAIKRLPKEAYYFCLVCLLLVICISIFSMEWGHIGLEEIPIGAKETIAPSNVFLLSRPACLLLTVILSVMVLVMGERHGSSLNVIFLSHLGVMSYSLFIWHQIMLAFYRYYFTAEISWMFVISFFVVLYFISKVSYRFVEKKFTTARSQITICLIACVCCLLSFAIYNKAGVVRDVPELGYQKSSIQRGMHRKYTDRIYKIAKKPFEDNGKMNVLLIGNSFARDFGSILMESEYKDKINLYLIKDKHLMKDRVFEGVDAEMIRKSDFAFIFSSKDDVPDFIWYHINPSKIYGIGTKTFGDSNGIIYKNRHSTNYFQQTIAPRKEYVELNKQWSESWGDHYINLMELSLDENGNVKIFTPDKMFMSQDCRHLTQAGAKYMASMINFDKIFVH